MNNQNGTNKDAALNEAKAPKVRKHKRGKKALGILVFILVFALALMVVNDVIRQKWNYKDNSAAQQIVQGYYREKDHTLDVLCLGASTVRNGLSPLEMYEDYGFTAYSRATSIQLPVVSYHLLRETLETQDIKAVVIDSTTLVSTILRQQGDTMTGKMHEAIDYMPWSKYKLDLIRDVVEMDASSSYLDYVFPLYAYHDRWSEIDEEDFTYRSWGDSYFYKGQYPILRTTRYTFPDNYMKEEGIDESDSFYVADELAEYYDKMIDLCREKGIEFVMIKTPVQGWDIYRHNVIDAYAQSRGVTFIDYNNPELLSEIGFDSTTDFADSGRHMNLLGAKRLSMHLGDYLSDVCDFEDKRGLAEYASWEESCEKYDSLLEDIELSQESNMITFLKKLKNPNYISILATQYDTSFYFNESAEKAFGELGIDAPFGQKRYLSYLALLDGGEVVYQQMDEDLTDSESLQQYSTQYDGHDISVVSNSSPITDNQADIFFDGVDLSPHSVGFNFVVYDRGTDQIVTSKGFNTSPTGKAYTEPNPFSAVLSDPVSYLAMLDNEDYITVISAGVDGSRYMPGIVNDQLAAMGLIPLDQEVNRPYIAVLNGSEIVLNRYGEPGTELSESCQVEGTPIAVVSSAAGNSAHVYISVGSEEPRTNKNRGLTFYVYSKSEQSQVVYNRFDWSNNYYSATRVSTKNNATELLMDSTKAGYDVICMYSRPQNAADASESAMQALKDYGFDQLGQEDYYIGVMLSDGRLGQKTGPEPVEQSYDRDGVPISLEMTDKAATGLFGGTAYALEGTGLSVILYDAENRAVLTQTRLANAVEESAADPFSDVRNEPLEYLKLTADEDYITVLGVSAEGSRYMPALVNDVLIQMGLIPLDQEFTRPYLAVLDGTEVVYNAYGETGTELSYTGQVAGVDIGAVSSAKSDNAHLYVSFGGETQQWTKDNIGLAMAVYSKSEGRIVSTNRYNWSNNYMAPTQTYGVTNALELMNLARESGYDILCVYMPGGNGGVLPEGTLQSLAAFGFDQLGDTCYVAVLHADGRIEQVSLEDNAVLETELEGMPVTLSAGSEFCSAVFGGIEYPTRQGQLSLFAYDSQSRAVLTQNRYSEESPKEPAELIEARGNPVDFLDRLTNEDYISVLGVSGEGSRYMPGVVNDKLSQMGLIPLDGAFNQPYIGVLDGPRVVYNAYGEPGSEISALCNTSDLDVSVVSSAKAGDAHLYLSVGDVEMTRSSDQTGLSIAVYSKSEGRLVSTIRYDWSNNYMASKRVNGTTNLLELLPVAREADYDLLWVYMKKDKANKFSDSVLEPLARVGLDQLSTASCYVGLVRYDGQIDQLIQEDAAILETDLDGMPVTLVAGSEGCSATFGGVEYPSGSGQLSLFVYDRASRAVLTQVRYSEEPPKEPAELTEVRGLPLDYLDRLVNEDYIAVLGVSGEGSRYMPGLVNDKLGEMGLIPLDGAINRPYIAVLDGGAVVYNAYGEPETKINANCAASDVPVEVESSAEVGDAHLSVAVGESTLSRSAEQIGLSIAVYSKAQACLVSTIRYDWNDNALAQRRVNGMTELSEILSVARECGYDVLCLYGISQDARTIPESARQSLAELGLDQTQDGCYAGILHADGRVEQLNQRASVTLESELEGRPVALFADAETGSATFDGVEYAISPATLNVFVYDPATRSVLAQARYPGELIGDALALEEAAQDPLAYLELLGNEDYIAVLGVSAEGSRYMPGLVNDALVGKGLIPLDQEINRPYIAVLDGGEAVYNSYGEPGTELSCLCRTSDVEVAVVSGTQSGNKHLYVSVNGIERTIYNKDVGLTVAVYSKSRDKIISWTRYDWSDNYLAEKRVNGTTSALELYTAAKSSGYDMLCVYPAKSNEEVLPSEVLDALNQIGFDQLDDRNYVAILYPDGRLEQVSELGSAKIMTELEGIPVKLTAGNQSFTATFNGVEYPIRKGELSLFVYDPATRAVLTQVRYASESEE